MGSTATLTGVIRQLRPESHQTPDDPELLARYARDHDQAAFVTLVERYGCLVLGVARRHLADHHQAEDVFQATFLALARAATRLGRRATLANWLYTVALRQARKTRGRNARRESLERAVPPHPGADPLDEITGRELLRVVDDELARLPDRFRLPVLLCCVQGLSREEAAKRLGWSDGTVKGRLERGRARLAARLAARGFAPSAMLLAPLAAVTVPAELLTRTTALTGRPWSESIPATVATLAATGSSRKLLPTVALVSCVLGIGLAGWTLALGGNNAVDPSNSPPMPVLNREVNVAVNADPNEDDPLPDGSTLRFGTTRFRHGSTIQNLVVSADGKIAAAGSGQRRFGSVRIYDLTTGRVLLTLEPSASFVEAIALSPDGKTLATKRDHSVYLYSAATGLELGKIGYPGANPSTITNWLTFSPDGKRIVVGAAEKGKGIHLLDLAKGEVIRTFPHTQVVFAAAFSPNGKQIAGGGYDSENNTYFVRLWDADTGKELRRFLTGDGGIRSLAFSADGSTLAVGADGGSKLFVRVFEVDTGKERVKIAFPDGSSVRSVALSANGRTVAASGGSTTRLYDVETGKERIKIDRRAIGLRFSPDGSSLVGAVWGAIYRWDTTTGRPLTPSGGDSVVDQIEVTANSKRLVTRGQDGDAHVWDSHTDEHLRGLTVGWQRGLALSLNGRFLVWPVEDETVKFKDKDRPNAIVTGSRLQLFDLEVGRAVERFGGFEGEAHDLAFTPDGKTLVTVDHGSATVRFWDVATGKIQRSFRVVRDEEKGNQHYVWHARLSPDGKVLAVAYQRSDNTTAFFGHYSVRLWDVASGKELHELNGHWHYVEGLAFSHDSRYLVTASEPLAEFAQKQLKQPADQVFVWDVVTGKAIARLPIGGTAGAFSPDGKILAVATPDGTIQLWDVATWKVRGEFRGHRDRVTALAFAPDGRLFSGSVDTTVLAWDVRAAKAPAGTPRP